MSEVTEEVKNKIVEHLKKIKRSCRSKDIAKALKMEKRIVDKAVSELVKEGRVEWVSFGGETLVKLPEGAE